MKKIVRNLVVLVVLLGLVVFLGGCKTLNDNIMKKQAEMLPREIQTVSIPQSPLPKEITIQVGWAPDIEVEKMTNEDLAEALAKMEKAVIEQFVADKWNIVPESPLKLDVKITYFQKGSATARWLSSYAAAVATLGEGVAGTSEIRLFISLKKDEELILDGNIWMRTSKKGSLSGLSNVLEASTKFYTIGMIRKTLAEGIVQVIDHFGGFPPNKK